jgi:hypothetical protein
MKVSTEIDNNFGYEKITQLVDNIPLNIPDSVNQLTYENSHTMLLGTFLQYWLTIIDHYRSVQRK